MVDSTEEDIRLKPMIYGPNVTNPDYNYLLQQKKIAGDKEDANAQYNVGALYYLGICVPKNYNEALDWFGKAAKQGSARAQNNLAVMHDMGLGVKKDFAEAERLYIEAANQKSVVAQNNLGIRNYSEYLFASDRINIERRLVLAYMWLTIAIAHGDVGKKDVLDEIEERMEANLIKLAQDEASDYWEKHFNR